MPENVLKTVDPASFICILDGVLIDGYADDTQVKIGRNSPSWKLKVGLTGALARFKMNDQSGFVEFSLLQTSDANDYLMQKCANDEAFGTGTFPISGEDKLGTTQFDAINCFLDKPADVDRGNEIKTVVWRVIVPKLDLTVGGNFTNVDS